MELGDILTYRTALLIGVYAGIRRGDKKHIVRWINKDHHSDASYEDMDEIFFFWEKI